MALVNNCETRVGKTYSFIPAWRDPMNRIKVCMSGVSGWVGKAMAPVITDSQDMELVGAVSRSYAGKSLSEITGRKGHNLMISGSIEEALRIQTDVMIDYTSADAVKSNILTAIRHGVHCVVGSSGLTDSDYEEIDAAARKNKVGVVAAGNFALSAALLLHFATVAARYMPSWEIIDYASGEKPDAPSGTARELAYRLSKVGKPYFDVAPDRIIGPKESRGATLNGNQVHSIRLPGHIIGSEVSFGKPDERLVLKYDGGSGAGPYIEGTFLAVRKVQDLVGLTRGLDMLLDL